MLFDSYQNKFDSVPRQLSLSRESVVIQNVDL